MTIDINDCTIDVYVVSVEIELPIIIFSHGNTSTNTIFDVIPDELFDVAILEENKFLFKFMDCF